MGSETKSGGWCLGFLSWFVMSKPTLNSFIDLITGESIAAKSLCVDLEAQVLLGVQKFSPIGEDMFALGGSILSSLHQAKMTESALVCAVTAYRGRSHLSRWQAHSRIISEQIIKMPESVVQNHRGELTLDHSIIFY